MTFDIPKHILQRLEENDKLARKFHEIEINMLSILNFKDFFENLLTTISKTFAIPHVWFTLIRGGSVYTQIQALSDSEVINQGIGYVSETLFKKLVGNSPKPILVNCDLTSYSSLVPERSDYTIGSMAIAPISLDGEIIGSLNQADPNPNRFSPDINSDFLQQLALKISLCLSNVSAHEKLRAIAFYDPLTGLLNRRVMEKILKREFERSRRYNTELSVIFIDLDYFKTINDTYGHDQGDAALVLVSEALFDEKRETDVVARFAGDEFVVILPSTDEISASCYMMRVKERLEQTPLATGDKSVIIRLSFGVATCKDPDTASPDALIKKADLRLFEAKKNREPILN